MLRKILKMKYFLDRRLHIVWRQHVYSVQCTGLLWRLFDKHEKCGKTMCMVENKWKLRGRLTTMSKID